MKSKIGIVGLGKLGLPIACAMAKRGFEVMGIEKSRDRRIQIQNFDSSIIEPEVLRLLRQFRDYPGSFTMSTCLPCAVHFAEIIFIVLPTPSESSGAFSGEFLFRVSDHIGRILRDLKQEKYVLIVILSTVMPGMMDKIKEIIETTSKKKCGKDFGLCYNPEFIALGDIIHTFLNPDFVLVGESDPHAGNILENIYSNVCENNPPIIRMNFINAELSKLTLNAFITMKISFANTLAEICEKISKANVDKITFAVGKDRRVGEKYFKGAMPYSGHCFPRDSRAFRYVAKNVGANAPIAEATDEVNSHQIARIIEIIKKNLKSSSQFRVGILGIAFKVGVNTTEESPGLKIAQQLAKEGLIVDIYDPVDIENLNELLLENMHPSLSVESCVAKADIIVITNPCKEFQDLGPENFKKNSMVIDCWRILDASKFKNQKRVRYFAIGVSDKP